MSSDTPRTDACPHCGADDYDPEDCDFLCDSRFYPETNTFVQSRLCAEREKSKKLKAEVESLREQLQQAVDIAEEFWNNSKKK